MALIPIEVLLAGALSLLATLTNTHCGVDQSAVLDGHVLVQLKLHCLCSACLTAMGTCAIYKTLQTDLLENIYWLLLASTAFYSVLQSLLLWRLLLVTSLVTKLQ